MLSGGEVVAQHLEFVQQAKQMFTNWPNSKVVLKGPDFSFGLLRKLTTDKLQMRPFGKGSFYPKK